MAETKKLQQKNTKRTLSWLMIICRPLLMTGTKKQQRRFRRCCFDYSGSQTRTDDNLINSQVLYQLSYAGIMHGNALSSQGAIPQLLSAR